MRYIGTPHLPERPVTCVVVDGRISPSIAEALTNLRVEFIRTRAHQELYQAISCHPDIVLHHLGEDKILYAPGTDKDVLKALEGRGFELLKGCSDLTASYPKDIAYNVARVGPRAFHNLKYTDPVLLGYLKEKDIELVHVNQGYAKCSVSIVDKNSIITADKGIALAAERKGIEALLIGQDENIALPGLDKGFIGGCSGMIDSKRWAISGDFETLKSADLIYDFLRKKNIEVISLSKEQVVDIGSIIPILTE